jgi:hypothetical protein
MKTKTISVFVTLMLCSLAYSQQTVDELGDKIESAAKAKSAKQLKALCFNTGEPKELTDAMSSLFSVFEDQNLQASEAKIHSTKDHTPEVKLPGSFQGKELEYLIPPTHWIVISLSSKEGENPKMNFKLSFPAVMVGDVWRIPGIKYK